jgi:hypothetical protein
VKITLQMTMGIAAIFAVVTFYVAFTGFASVSEIADAQVAADARGFAWFWAFLGIIASATGLGSWWLIRTGGEGANPPR